MDQQKCILMVRKVSIEKNQIKPQYVTVTEAGLWYHELINCSRCYESISLIRAVELSVLSIFPSTTQLKSLWGIAK